MARLIGRSAAEVNADRIGIARSFAEAHRCYLILKGARSVIATPAGKIFVNPTGNPGMASGGMGDVLAGMITAFLGQGLSAEDAMKLGVYLHGYAGDNIARERGQAGLIASDIIEGLPSGLRDLARQSAPPPVVA
jgi:NAD(P)H-hydrate repair Nnr-like enzyme with NAD(P)H-hydrate dehydratase domain